MSQDKTQIPNEKLNEKIKKNSDEFVEDLNKTEDELVDEVSGGGAPGDNGNCHC